MSMTYSTSPSRRSQYAIYDRPRLPHTVVTYGHDTDYSRVYPASPQGIKRYGQGNSITPSTSKSPHVSLDCYSNTLNTTPNFYLDGPTPSILKVYIIFLHKEKRIFTPMDIWDDEIREVLMGFADYLHSKFEKLNTHEPTLKFNEVDLVIEVEAEVKATEENDNPTLVGYYYFASSKH